MDSLLSFAGDQLKKMSDKDGSSENQGGQQHSGGDTGGSYGGQGGGYKGYNNPEGGYNQTGGAHLNRPAGHQYDSEDGPRLDSDVAVNHASKGSGDSGDSSMFSSAMSFLKDNKGQSKDDVDEEHVTSAHNKAYGQGQPSGLDAGGMGAAAALQAFKKFTGGEKKEEKPENMQSQLIGMAMSEAAKLFDSSGGATSGNKQDVVNSAGMTVMKLIMKSKMSQMTGGSDSGGLGQLAGLASKFM